MTQFTKIKVSVEKLLARVREVRPQPSRSGSRSSPLPTTFSITVEAYDEYYNTRDGYVTIAVPRRPRRPDRIDPTHVVSPDSDLARYL